MMMMSLGTNGTVALFWLTLVWVTLPPAAAPSLSQWRRALDAGVWCMAPRHRPTEEEGALRKRLMDRGRRGRRQEQWGDHGLPGPVPLLPGTQPMRPARGAPRTHTSVALRPTRGPSTSRGPLNVALAWVTSGPVRSRGPVTWSAPAIPTGPVPAAMGQECRASGGARDQKGEAVGRKWLAGLRARSDWPWDNC